MSQHSVPCSVYRGGTSRGLFFQKKDLPEDEQKKKAIFMQGIDAYNPSQIDGLGAGTSHTSKVCVISSSHVDGVDIDYTFYQIGIGKEIVDDKGTCGNLMPAVGAYAVDEGLVSGNDRQSHVEVFVFNTNINKILNIRVPIENGKAKVIGDFRMPGLVDTGAKISVSILSPGGGKTGKTQPLGTTYNVTTYTRTYNVSFVDVVNPMVFVSAEELNIKGNESTHELALNKDILDELNIIRANMAIAVGMAKDLEEAFNSPSVPKIAIVSAPRNYKTSEGKEIKAEEVDIVARMVSMGKFHKTFAGSGLYCLAAASMLAGTIPNQHTKQKNDKTIKIGHPEGVAEVTITGTKDGNDIADVGLDRTARRIIKGNLYFSK